MAKNKVTLATSAAPMGSLSDYETPLSAKIEAVQATMAAQETAKETPTGTQETVIETAPTAPDEPKKVAIDIPKPAQAAKAKITKGTPKRFRYFPIAGTIHQPATTDGKGYYRVSGPHAAHTKEGRLWLKSESYPLWELSDGRQFFILSETEASQRKLPKDALEEISAS